MTSGSLRSSGNSDSNFWQQCCHFSLNLNRRPGARALSIVAEAVVGNFWLELVSEEEFLRFICPLEALQVTCGLGERL
jgi:hypothetical protein